ncbi:MAG TPA: hypothetical protein DCP92_15115 [Nitrospiraceae bacterium]|nr:hypothetical protein [Nitrospiraceae bacterium]
MIIVLKSLNWLPLVLEQDTMRRYDSIEEVKAKLNMKDLYVPSYFPQSITWPPSEILAQTKPYPAVLMAFNQTGKRGVALVISQAASSAFSGNEFIKFVQITEKVPYRLKAREALLEVGTCKNDEPCSRLSWTEGNYRIALAMKSPPFELIRIAESMLH